MIPVKDWIVHPLQTHFMSKYSFALLFIVLSLALKAQLPEPIYSTPGVYTWNTGNMIFENVTIRVWGGGGGGAVGLNGNGGGAGGGGAFAEYTFTSLGPNQTITLTVGAGGVAGANATNFIGGDGGVSSAQTGNTLLLAEGGKGGGNISRHLGGRGGIPTGHQAGRGFNGGQGNDGNGNPGGAGGSSAGTHANGNNGGMNGHGQTPAPSGGGFGGAAGGAQGRNSGEQGGLPGGGGGGGGTAAGSGGHGRITISYASVQEGAPLPVELVFFSARVQEGEVRLAWRTASEINSWYYSVEHSTDGRRFSEVGDLDAAGFSHHNIDYSFNHRPVGGGTQYYRLKMVDLDGTYEYSPVQAVDLGGLTITPPFRAWTDGSQVWVADFQSEETGSFQIIDLQGRLLRATPAARGTDAITSIPMPAVPGGIYLLRWQPASGAMGQTVKFSHQGF